MPVKPLAVDLYAGISGWGDGLLAEGWQMISFDIIDMRKEIGITEPRHPDNLLVLQDVLTLHGSQFRSADLIVGSSPCQEFSYRAMPWKRAKALGPPLLGIKLFEAQFRIQREACEAAGRHIPMVVENVRGAQKWVGRSRWNFGSYHLWGDVPALMPFSLGHRKQDGDPSWFYDNYENSARRFSSGSKQRKEWSAQISKIPLPLAQHIARVYYPRER